MIFEDNQRVLRNPVDVFDIEQKQRNVLANLQEEHIKNYQPLKPQTTEKPSFLTRRIDNARQAIDKLQHIKGKSPAEISTKAHKIFGSISDSMRKNPQEMLTLIAEYPRAISLVDPEILTKEFALKALERTPRIYDLLPEDLQKDQDIINKHIEMAIKKPHYMDIENSLSSGFSINAAIPNISSLCPVDKWRTQDNYVAAAEKAWCANGINTLFRDPGGDRHITVGATTVLMGYFQGRTQLDFDSLNAKALSNCHQNMLQAVYPNAVTNWQAYDSSLKRFALRHRMPELITQYEEAAWHNYIKKAQQDPSRLKAHEEIIKQNAPEKIKNEYFRKTSHSPTATQPMPEKFAFSKEVNTPLVKNTAEFTAPEAQKIINNEGYEGPIGPER